MKTRTKKKVLATSIAPKRAYTKRATKYGKKAKLGITAEEDLADSTVTKKGSKTYLETNTVIFDTNHVAIGIRTEKYFK